MGHKTHPIGFRLGVIKGWQSRWFAGNGKQYSKQVVEDWRIREVIRNQYAEAGISRVEVERSTQDITVNVHTARPGIVIGRGGQRVDELRRLVEGATDGKRVRLNVLEIRQPELDAYLVARNVADQLERRVMYRRATRQAVMRSMQAGARGIKVMVSGRLGGAEIARREKVMDGRVPLHTLRADIDYGLAEANTTMGRIGVKVWIYRGDVLKEPERTQPALPDVPAEVVAAAQEALAAQSAAPPSAAAPPQTATVVAEEAPAPDAAAADAPAEAAPEPAVEEAPAAVEAAASEISESEGEADASTEEN